MSDEQIVDLPNGSRVVYRDANHAYHRWNSETGKAGRRLTGVTTACKTLDFDPGNLLRWAARTQLVGAARYVRAQGAAALALMHDDPEACWRELAAMKLTFEDVRDAAGRRGTNVHERAFEALARGEAFPDMDGLTDEEVGMVRAVQAFFFDHSPKFRLIEQIVYSERLGVAGRLDGLGEIGECEREGCPCHLIDEAVVDLKTGGFISAAAHAQVGGAYPLLAVESGFIDEPPPGLILQVRDDGTYTLISAQADTDDFEVAVAAYRVAGKINGAARKAREAVAA